MDYLSLIWHSASLFSKQVCDSLNISFNRVKHGILQTIIATVIVEAAAVYYLYISDGSTINIGQKKTTR